ncbi:heat shock protein Hsp-12.2 [Biomphalaria glabrata]|nr:heat shock protein Hsp-12.2 [Biomphalaria glabrata]
MIRIVRQPNYFDEVLPLARLADELSGNYDPGYSFNHVSSGDDRAIARRYGDSEIHNTDKEFRVRMDLALQTRRGKDNFRQHQDNYQCQA